MSRAHCNSFYLFCIFIPLSYKNNVIETVNDHIFIIASVINDGILTSKYGTAIAVGYNSTILNTSNGTITAELASNNGIQASIRDGVKEGDTIILYPSAGLLPGAMVAARPSG